MRILFLLDPLDGLKPKKDSSIAMMRALQARGHACFAAELTAMRIEAETGPPDVTVRALPLQLSASNLMPWYQADAPIVARVAGFDAVIMRKDPPVDANYTYATQLLSLASAAGARVFNAPQALRDFNEKLAIFDFPEWMVPTLVSADINVLRDFLTRHEDVILKPLDGMGGAGIYRLTPADPNLSVILDAASLGGCRLVMLQRYIPAITQGDKRILLINGEPIPYALARIPQQGETRGNLAAGGRGVAQALTDRDSAIAASVGPRLAAAGLFLVGLDVIGDYLTEINVTSPTCMVEIAAQTDCDPAAVFAQQLEKAMG